MCLRRGYLYIYPLWNVHGFFFFLQNRSPRQGFHFANFRSTVNSRRSWYETGDFECSILYGCGCGSREIRMLSKKKKNSLILEILFSRILKTIAILSDPMKYYWIILLLVNFVANKNFFIVHAHAVVYNKHDYF